MLLPPPSRIGWLEVSLDLITDANECSIDVEQSALISFVNDNGAFQSPAWQVIIGTRSECLLYIRILALPRLLTKQRTSAQSL